MSGHSTTLHFKSEFLKRNRSFYRYSGHIELIRFKEYYTMPRGHEHISFVFSSAFRDIFSESFLEPPVTARADPRPFYPL